MTLVFIPRHISELKIPFGKEIAMKISKKLSLNRFLYKTKINIIKFDKKMINLNINQNPNHN